MKGAPPRPHRADHDHAAGSLMNWLTALPDCTVPVAAALVLAAESGLPIGC